MKLLTDLATSALLGTDRRPPAEVGGDDAISKTLSGIAAESVEKKLLQSAAVLGTCSFAGWLPAIAGDMPVVPAENDELNQQALSQSRQQTLSTILKDGPLRLQAESFQKLASVGRGVPYRLIPAALDIGKRNVAVRPYLLAVVGQRGSWLAVQNKEWSFAIGSGLEALDEKMWDEGSLDQRKLYLKSLRDRDAAKARELVIAALPNEGAKERAALVDCLSVGISQEDEDLLETLLKDKSKEVRQTALQLLGRIEGSRIAQRMIARIEPLISLEKKFFGGKNLKIEPPAAFDPTWKQDLVEEKSGVHGMGERAWWLRQFVELTPLSWWESHTGLKPAELIQWAADTDWKEALLQGWRMAVSLQKNILWAEALLMRPAKKGEQVSHDLDLFESLPLALREKHFLSLWRSDDYKKSKVPSSLLNRFLDAVELHEGVLSFETAKAILQQLKAIIHGGEASYDWQLRGSLMEFACLTPAALFDECNQDWDLSRPEVSPFTEAITRMGIIIDQRRQLQSLI